MDVFGDNVQGEHDAEAALEALRAAIGQPNVDFGSGSTAGGSNGNAAGQASGSGSGSTLHQAGDGASNGNTADGINRPILSAVQQQALDRALSTLNQLNASNQTIMDNLNISQIVHGLVGSVDLLVKSSKKQTEIVRGLHSQLGNSSADSIDPSLTTGFVPRQEYDDLKAKYDALLASSQTTTTRRPRQPRNIVAVESRGEDGRSPDVDASGEGSGGPRKKRSMRLEHLVHKMANRRLGVDYSIAGFETPGTKDLPDPSSEVPTEDDSLNGIQEFRPTFGEDAASVDVAPFITAVIDDVVQAWEDGEGQGDPDVDRKKIVDSVHVYWVRLSRRYEEQLARDRGEVHKDELTRRKQNQYRRQQSLVARRQAAFNGSPLNVCKLRALYRTVLTIDFAAPTNERPDPKRHYSEQEWYAYQKNSNGGRTPEAHEVVDMFWLSPAARTLLNILDCSATDQAARMKRKGKPKQPSPLFHLPSELWDKSSLPQLRPKSAETGLPMPGTSGIILFKFHVDEKVQQEHPEWAEGLYDNPPVPETDQFLPSLTDVMNASVFAYLKTRVKAAREAAYSVNLLSADEVVEINSRPPIDLDSLPNLPEDPGPSESSGLDLNNLPQGLDSLFGLAPYQFGNATASGSGSGSNGGMDGFNGLDSLLGMGGSASPASAVPNLAGSSIGPSPGSSLRARKQSKRMASELPGGAATPVAKRKRDVAPENVGDEAQEVEGDLMGDNAFLESL